MTDALPDPATTAPAPHLSASSRMTALAERAAVLGTQRVAVSEAVDTLGDAGLGMTLLLLMLPVFIAIPGLPVGIVFGFFVAILGVQMAMGAHTLRLPQAVRTRTLAAAHVVRMAGTASGWLRRAEHLLRPGRLPMLTTGVAQRMLGVVLVLQGIALAVPIPFGNHPPALAVVAIGLGLMERDGLPIALGLAISVLAIGWNLLLIMAGVEVLAWVLQFIGW